jgi:hypothetical protein
MTHRTRRQRARRRACRRHRRWRRALAAERRRRARKFRNAPIARLFFALPLARRPESRAHPRASNALAAPCSGAHRRLRKRRRRGARKLVEAAPISCVATSKMRKLREPGWSRRVVAVGRRAVAVAHERQLDHARAQQLAADVDLHLGAGGARHAREADRALERRRERAARDLALADAGHDHFLVAAQHAAVLEQQADELRAVAAARAASSAARPMKSRSRRSNATVQASPDSSGWRDSSMSLP